MRNIYFIFCFLIASYFESFSQFTDFGQFRQFYIYSKKEQPLTSFISYYDKINHIIKDNSGDTIQIIASAHWRSQNQADTIANYNFKRDSLKRIISIEITNGEGKPAYYRMPDTDNVWSKNELTYDKKNRISGYKWYTDTILSLERKFEFDDNNFIVSDIEFTRRCCGWDTIRANHSYSLSCKIKFDTLRCKNYKYSNNYHTYEVFEKQFDLYFNEPTRAWSRYFKVQFDSLERKVEESSFLNGYGERQLFDYNDENKLLSIRFCDINYRLRNHDGDEDGIAIIIYIYKKNSKKPKTTIYLNEKGDILFKDKPQ